MTDVLMHLRFGSRESLTPLGRPHVREGESQGPTLPLAAPCCSNLFVNLSLIYSRSVLLPADDVVAVSVALMALWKSSSRLVGDSLKETRPVGE